MSDVTPTLVGADRNPDDFAATATLSLCQATNLVCLYDAVYRITYLNPAGCAMVGLQPDEDVGDYAIADLFAVEQRPFIDTVVVPALRRDGRWEGRLRLHNFSEPTHGCEVHWSAFALSDSDGHRIGTSAFTTDLTPRKEAERALRDQQALLASLLDHLPLGIGVYDRQGNLIHSNQRLQDYLGLSRLPSCEPATSRRWHGYDTDGEAIPPSQYPGARALRGESVTPGVDFRYAAGDATERWMRISAVPFRREAIEQDEAIVVVQDVDDLKRGAERVEAAGRVIASQSRFLEATLSSIPDQVYAFDRQHRFAYVNHATLAMFGLSREAILGRTFTDLDYPRDLAERLDGYVDRILTEGVTVEDELFFASPTGQAAYLNFIWGPVRAEDGTVELVVGVSRDTSERRAFEAAITGSEARLRAASDLVGLAVYSWDPVSGSLDWDERLRAMWGLPPDAAVDMDVYESGIHPADLPRVRQAIAACADPGGSGQYSIEYRVVGRDDGITRYIATSGQTRFAHGRAIGFIGAAIDVTAQRRAEAAIRSSEAQFRSFAEHSSNLIWIVDSATNEIVYRSAAFERIWGVPSDEAPAPVTDWLNGVHTDDRRHVVQALASAQAGEIAQIQYRIVRPTDGAIRWLRDTSFPIPDETGSVTRIGGITEDLTQEDVRQVYVVSPVAAEARRIASVVRGLGYRARTFDGKAVFLDLAPVLAPGCVVVDLRKAMEDGLAIPRELKARSVPLPMIALDEPRPDVCAAVAAMKAGAIDYVVFTDEASLRDKLSQVMAECQSAIRPPTRDENAGARVARLTPREREVLVGLVNGGTNKTIALELGISPRTVELHRAQVMSRLDASNLSALLQVALSAGIAPTS